MSVATATRVEVATVTPTRTQIVLTRLPDRILQVLLGVFVAAYAMAAFGVYHPWTVGPLAVILVALSWRYVPTDVLPSKTSAWASLAAVILAVLWIGVQFPFETEFLVANRDPGIYSNIAAALAHTGQSSIDMTKAIADAKGIPGATAVFGGSTPEADGFIRLQGGDAVPSLIGIGYWFAGINGLTVVDSVIGGICLIGVYSLGRRMLGPVWALLPPVVLGLSMPMVYFSRAPYTEIISFAIFVGALTCLWSAFSTGRRTDFVMAGAFAGATSMTRIDATLGLAVLIAAFGLVLAGLARPRGDVPLVKSFVAFLVPAAVFTALGIFDLLHNFNRYVNDLGTQAKALWALLAFIVVVSFAVALLRRVLARRHGTLATSELGVPLSDRGARRLGLVAAIVVQVLFLYWAVRPLFYHARFNTQVPYQLFTESLQRNAGLPVDGLLTYDEYSLYWFVWYFGIPLVVAASLGMGLLLYRALTRRRPGLLVFWALTMGVALLYLNKISIAPDQMWAFRRVLPIVAPGFVIAAVFAVRWVFRAGRSRARLVPWARVGGVVGALLLVGGTVLSWNPHLFRQTEYSNQANQVRAVCADIGSAKDVVLVTSGLDPYGLTIRTFCDVNVVGFQSGADGVDNLDRSRASLALLAARLPSGTPVVTLDSSVVPWQGAAPAYLNSAIITVWDRTLLSAPDKVLVSTRTVWAGTLESDGSVRG